MQPKVTVVIPIYKVEPYLRQCLDSVVDQTYHDLEVLLIDDGSPDNCGAICDAYAQNDPRIRVIHKKNAGVGAARNDGIRLATGEWLVFLDADDWWELDFIEKMLDAMPQEKVDVLCSAGYIGEFPSRSIVKYIYPESFVDIKGEKKTFLIAKTMAPQYGMGKQKDYTSSAFVWGRLYNTTFLQHKVPGFNLRLHPTEDILYSLQVFGKAKAVAVCNCIGCHYRQAVPTASVSRFNPQWPYMFNETVVQLRKFLSEQHRDELLIDAFYAREFILIKYISKCYFFHPDNPAPYRQVVREVRELKKRPDVFAALHRTSNRFLNKKYILLKYTFRLPWVWPAKLLFSGYRILRNGI